VVRFQTPHLPFEHLFGLVVPDRPSDFSFNFMQEASLGLWEILRICRRCG
jgi:hypothetical protein